MNITVSLWVVNQERLGNDACTFTLKYFSHYLSPHVLGFLWIDEKKARILVWKLKANNDSGELCRAKGARKYYWWEPVQLYLITGWTHHIEIQSAMRSWRC